MTDPRYQPYVWQQVTWKQNNWLTGKVVNMLVTDPSTKTAWADLADGNRYELDKAGNVIERTEQ